VRWQDELLEVYVMDRHLMEIYGNLQLMLLEKLYGFTIASRDRA
jgi:hypothetical protein